MFGDQAAAAVAMSGRTDRAIALEMLTVAGVPEPLRQVDAFHAVRPRTRPTWPPGRGSGAGRCPARPRRSPRSRSSVTGRRRRAARAGRPEPGLDMVQSLLTGNVRPLAEVKLGPLGLTEHLDLDAGAYGTEQRTGPSWCPWPGATRPGVYGQDFSGAATVLVGDTPLDVGAALATGARAVGVATGGFTLDELAASGAHAVLPDLADTGAVLAAILGENAA